MNFFNELLGLIIAFPFFIVLLLIAYASFRKKESKKTVFMIVDGSALFFWVSIISLFEVRDPQGEPLIWVFACFMLLSGMIMALQYRIRGKIDIMRVLRSIWRIGFLVSIVMYVWLITDTISMYMDMV